MFIISTASTTDNPETTENQDNPIKEPKSPCKRCQTPDSSDAKRVKTEPVEDQQTANNDPVTVKQEPDIVPGPSNDQVVSSKHCFCYLLEKFLKLLITLLLISMRKIMYKNCQ